MSPHYTSLFSNFTALKQPFLNKIYFLQFTLKFQLSTAQHTVDNLCRQMLITKTKNQLITDEILQRKLIKLSIVFYTLNQAWDKSKTNIGESGPHLDIRPQDVQSVLEELHCQGGLFQGSHWGIRLISSNCIICLTKGLVYILKRYEKDHQSISI